MQLISNKLQSYIKCELLQKKNLFLLTAVIICNIVVRSHPLLYFICKQEMTKLYNRGEDTTVL